MYLVLHTTYTHVEIALGHEGTLTHASSVSKYDASALLIGRLEAVCQNAQVSLADIEYIVVHVGPGPFTTLRTSIATANGIAFATGLKLVGVDGLQTFVEEHHQEVSLPTIALLNAFAFDTYYAIADTTGIKTGILYGIDELTEFLKAIQTPALFIGNGVILHQDLIQQICQQNAIISHPIPESCSLSAVARKGWQQWNTGQTICDQALPLYLKSYSTPIPKAHIS